MKKDEILHELSILLVSSARTARMFEEYTDPFDERKETAEKAKRRMEALQAAMLMVDMHYEKQ